MLTYYEATRFKAEMFFFASQPHTAGLLSVCTVVLISLHTLAEIVNNRPTHFLLLFNIFGDTMFRKVQLPFLAVPWTALLQLCMK